MIAGALSGGEIAVISLGAFFGTALIAGLGTLACWWLDRRNGQRLR